MFIRSWSLVSLCALASGCGTAPDSLFGGALSGGATTVADATQGAYANPAPNLDTPGLDASNLGHSLFNRNWVTAPATTADIDGVGPLFNQRSCSGCHSRDGRSPPLDPQGDFLGMLLRLSVPGADPHGGPQGDPIYATQLRPNGILKVPGEGVAHVTYTELPGTYADGTTYSLQVPTYTIDGWSYGAPSPQLLVSPRVGPFVIGLGLLEAIPESAILANVRVGDPDGVVGRANYPFDPVNGTATLGRFGWKANVPSVRVQTAGALLGDMGITSTLNPKEICAPNMTECNAAPNGGSPEIDDARLGALVFYMQTLAVPARRDLGDATVRRGESLFVDLGCASCHVPTYETGTLAGIPQVSGQTIHPFTDLLLHDMGEALADGRTDFLATGTEWRTPPLWGIGLLVAVNGHERLLHDGRARGMAEAILWHGGEARAAAARFKTARADDRDALLRFLHSL